MITVSEARKSLPIYYEDLNDEEIQELVDYFYKVIYLFVDNYFKN